MKASTTQEVKEGRTNCWQMAEVGRRRSPILRDAIAGAGETYVLAVSTATPVWQERPRRGR